MNMIDAMKTGKPIRRKGCPRHVGSGGDGWICSRWLFGLLVEIYRLTGMVKRDDILAEDWEVKHDSDPRDSCARN